MHAGKVEKSRRLAAILLALKNAGGRGMTTMELCAAASSTRASSDISELRHAPNNYLIDSRYIGRSANGARIFRYWLRGQVNPGEQIPMETVRSAA